MDLTPILVGGDVQVNTTTLGIQDYPAVAALTNGGLVVTWQSAGGSGFGIYGQRYDANGAAVGGEFRVNTTTSVEQRYSSVTGLIDGGFLVTWSSSQDNNGWSAYAQRYDANGLPVGGEFRVAVLTDTDVAVTALADGGFIITSSSTQPGDPALGIYAQRYDANNAPVGPQFHVNTSTGSNQFLPAVAQLSDGGFIITWTSDVGDGDANGRGVYGQRYHADGSPFGGEFRVNTFLPNEQRFSSVAGLGDGG